MNTHSKQITLSAGIIPQRVPRPLTSDEVAFVLSTKLDRLASTVVKPNDHKVRPVVTVKPVNNNGWGKSLDISRTTVREATHQDLVDHTTSGKEKKASGKKQNKK